MKTNKHFHAEIYNATPHSNIIIIWSIKNEIKFATEIVGNKAKRRIKNECFKKTNQVNVCVSGGKKCSFFGKFVLLCFLETPALRFAFLRYFQWNMKPLQINLLPVHVFREERGPNALSPEIFYNFKNVETIWNVQRYSHFSLCTKSNWIGLQILDHRVQQCKLYLSWHEILILCLKFLWIPASFLFCH